MMNDNGMEDIARKIALEVESLRSSPIYYPELIDNQKCQLQPVDGMMRPRRIVDGRHIGIQIFIKGAWVDIA
jgi:hypothetical protein